MYHSIDNDRIKVVRLCCGSAFSNNMAVITVFLVTLIVITSCLITAHGNPFVEEKTTAPKSFPDGLKFGAATAAYQIEGAWNVDGKGWSSWDYLARTNPNHIVDNSNGDIAANSYYLYKRDVEMLKELGVDMYRFSISWPRILPYGRNYVNPLGIAYYNALIDELIDNDIVPYVTMFHWDLPQNLAELGGLQNDDFADWFGEYARVLYQNFGDRVKHWMTINEPYIHCYFSYGVALHAPQVFNPGTGFYDCGRQVLLANARAYHIYDDEFRASQGGQVGIVMSMEWAQPATDSQEDAQAVIDYFAFHFGQYMDPIFTEQGNYPQIMIDRVAAASAAQGLSASRLRPFSQEQIEYMKGTADFMGLNHYTTRIVYRNDSVIGMYMVPSPDDDGGFGAYGDPSWPASYPPSDQTWLREYGPGFYNLLVYIKDTYNNPTIYITENGFSTTTGLNDTGRVQYYRSYWSALIDAVNNGVNVDGYFAWSLMDNFEWSDGYTRRFGIYEVDMDDPNRKRTPRQSALVYKEAIRTRTIDFDYDPDPYADSAISSTGSLLTFVIVAFNLIM